MAKNTRWSSEDFKRAGLIQTANGSFVPSDRVTDGLKPKLVPEPLKQGNKKIRNATKSEVDGVKFDSQLEKYMHGLLTASNIHFEFQKEFELQRSFKYRDETVRSIKKIVDFYLPTRNCIIDTKGFANDVSPLKHKMLKSVLKHLLDMEPEIHMPSNRKECDLLLNKLLYDK